MTPLATVSSLDRHLPLVGRRLQQHHARGRAAAADVVLRGADAAAAAGAHLAPDALAREVLAGRDRVGRDLLPVALELLGDELREAGERALAHLRARDADHAGVVGLDDDPGVDLGCRRRRALAPRPIRAARTAVEAEREAAAGGGGADDEAAAREVWSMMFSWRSPQASPCLRRPASCDARPRGCADRCRSGRCWSSPRRCPCRSASGSSSAAPPRP